MSIWTTLHNAWVMIFGWMPFGLGIFFTVLLGLLAIILLIKIIAFILDAIPFL